MMTDLVREAGTFRSKGVGVYAGTELIHAGSPLQAGQKSFRRAGTGVSEAWFSSGHLQMGIGPGLSADG